jgi:hypothetical protein
LKVLKNVCENLSSISTEMDPYSKAKATDELIADLKIIETLIENIKRFKKEVKSKINKNF